MLKLIIITPMLFVRIIIRDIKLIINQGSRHDLSTNEFVILIPKISASASVKFETIAIR